MQEQIQNPASASATPRRAAILAALIVALGMCFGVWARAISSLLSGSGSGAAVVTASAGYVPSQLIVGHRAGPNVLTEIHAATGWAVSAAAATSGTPDELIVKLPTGVSVATAAARVKTLQGVTYAEPNYIAKAAGGWYPNDVGQSTASQGWERLQWNFLATKAGIDAPDAWRTLIKDGRAGAQGVTIAVLDTGVAYRDWGTFKRSPDFTSTRFVAPCDLVLGTVKDGRCTDPYALDRTGHGTFVASMIAESTNNKVGLTGLAYNASVMPVRVLGANDEGNAAAIALGVRYAVAHGAQVINLSIEFLVGVAAAQVPSLTSAISYAYRHGVTVVAAAGNDWTNALAYPANDRQTISVGATTADGCLANYSNTGSSLDLVAPGGGNDSALASGNCHPSRSLPGVFEMTFASDPPNYSKFGMPRGWYGTSMAAPEVSAAAAMVIASGVLGRSPSPDQILAQLEFTARPIGKRTPNAYYGHGLLDVGAAVSQTATASTGQTIRTAANGSRTVVRR